MRTIDGADLRVPLAGACARLFVELNLLNEGRIWSSRALAALDDTNRGSAWELELQSTLGHAFMFTESNSEQAESALRRGLEIADGLGDLSNKFRLLARLNMFYRRTGEYRHLLPVALEAEKVARLIGDTAGIAGAKALVGVSYHLVGNQTEAQVHLDEGVQGDAALRSTQPGHFAYARTPQIPLARVLWLRGFPDRAVECVRPLTGAATPRDVVMHCIALCWSASLFGWVGDWAAVESMASRLAAHAGIHGLTPYQAVAAGFRGQTMIARGELKAGIELLQSSLPRLHADRYELVRIRFRCRAVPGARGIGPVAGSSQGAARDHRARRTGGRGLRHARAAAPAWRARGARGDLEAAEASFAASVASGRTAGGIVLAIANGDVACPTSSVSKASRTHSTGLAETYARFSEGFETADLKAARLMLDETPAR